MLKRISLSCAALFVISVLTADSKKISNRISGETKFQVDSSSTKSIPFGAFGIRETEYNKPFSAFIRKPTRDRIKQLLDGARNTHMKIILILTNVPHNEDKTFSLEKWKEELNRFKDFDFNPYIDDGTIIGNYLMDEPYSKRDWGGKAVPFSDLVEMAKYSKQIFPNMKTIIRSPPSWLADGGNNPYLDIAWAQYSIRFGDAKTWADQQIAAANQLHLKLITGCNILDGGGTQVTEGTKEGRYSMTAAELKTAGKAMIGSSDTVVGFYLWKFNAAYFKDPAIADAVKELADFAKNRK